jgi:tetratricopeptide (TPR) repeat protein
MASLADQACQAACALDAEAYPPGFVSDLQARAWAELANAYRVCERYDKAEEALDRAYESFESGTHEQLLQASILEIEASLRRFKGKLPEALLLLTRACDLYLEAGEIHLAGRTMILKGMAHTNAKQAAMAIQCFEEGLSLLDRKRDPQTVLVASQALTACLVHDRQYGRAGKLLLKSGLRQALSSEPLALLRLRWVEAQIHAGLGRLPQAEHAFQEIRLGFQDRGLDYDAALAGLDLASVWLRQGRLQKVQELAAQILGIFQLVGVRSDLAKAKQLLEMSNRER